MIANPNVIRVVSIRQYFSILTGIVCASLAVGGCSKGDGRVAISGTVIVDGAPLESAAITFQPVDIHSARGSGGAIQHGKFKLPAHQGLTPGEYTVKVLLSEPNGRTYHHPERGETAEMQLTTFREDGAARITVQPKGNNHFDLTFTRAH